MTQNYVDQNNELHALDDVAFEHMLAAGCTPISQAEADAITESKKPAFVLADYKVLSQARVDSHYEVLYRGSVVNSAIGAEYQAAYDSAAAWLKDTTKPAPERVKALAETYGVGNEMAANVVVQKWTEAQSVAFDRRGAARLRAKLAIRSSPNRAGVDAAEIAGKASMEAVTFSV